MLRLISDLPWSSSTRRRRETIIALLGSVLFYGMERENISLLQLLRDAGYDVLVVVRPEESSSELKAELKRKGLRFVEAPYIYNYRRGQSLSDVFRNVAGILGGSAQLLRLIHTFRPAYLHVGALGDIANFLPALILVWTPLIYRCGDRPPEHHLLWRLLWRFVAIRSRRIIAVSHYIRRVVVQSGVCAAKVEVVYPLLQPRPTQLISPGPRRSVGTRFVYVGRLTREKGVDILVDAALRGLREFPNLEFWIAGPLHEGDEFCASLVERVNVANAASAIRFVGYIEDVDELMRCADVHICPTVSEEALGLVVLEAKRAGIPSIVFPTGGLVELIEDQVDGYLCPGNTASDLLDAIRFYARDPGIIRSHAAMVGRHFQRHTDDAIRTAFLKVYVQRQN